MKKLFVLSLLLFTTDSFATGISGGTTTAPCDNATLSKYTGTVNAEINWEPNTINLKWFDGDTELNVANTSQTCTYDGMITVPPQPTKLGYTFNGWKIPKMDFGTIPVSTDGTERWAKGFYNNSDYCWYDTTNGGASNVACNSDNNYNEIATHQWKVKFSHGALYGIAGCSTTNSTISSHGNPDIGQGIYCWCKATGYKATNTNIVKASLYTLSWTFFQNYHSIETCMQHCAGGCTNATEYNYDFRNALITPAQ